MRKRKRLYGYGISSARSAVRFAILVSERKLPRPDTRFRSLCAGICGGGKQPRSLRRVGAVVDLAFGDPIILKRCTVLSLTKNPPPERARCFQGAKDTEILGFRYRGARVWGDRWCFCTLGALKRELARRKRVRR
jgi:hypothetical protein